MLRVERVESQSQAARPLVDVGLTELISRHSGMPFERCLGMPSTDPAFRSEQARSFAATDPDQRIKATGVALSVRGYIAAARTGGEDAMSTNVLAALQAEEDLIVSGVPDAETDSALRPRWCGPSQVPGQRQRADIGRVRALVWKP